MIASYALTDNIPERSLGGFVSGYSPVDRNRLVLIAVPIVLFVCSGFFAINQPTSGIEQPATQALVMAFSRINTVESDSSPSLTDAIEVIPEPVSVEQPPPEPAQQVAAAHAIVDPALPETAAVDRSISQPVNPVAPDTVAISEAPETIFDAALEASTVEEVAAKPVEEVPAEPVATPRPPNKPVRQTASTVSEKPAPASMPVTPPVTEADPPVTQVAALQDAASDRHNPAPEAAVDPSEPIVIVNPDFLVPPDPPVYPPMSMKRHEQGTVVVRALVSGAGAAREVRIWQSSGFRRLDRAAQVAVQDWQFAPAVRLGLPVAAWVEVPVHFQLN